MKSELLIFSHFNTDNCFCGAVKIRCKKCFLSSRKWFLWMLTWGIQTQRINQCICSLMLTFRSPFKPQGCEEPHMYSRLSAKAKSLNPVSLLMLLGDRLPRSSSLLSFPFLDWQSQQPCSFGLVCMMWSTVVACCPCGCRHASPWCSSVCRC